MEDWGWETGSSWAFFLKTIMVMETGTGMRMITLFWRESGYLSDDRDWSISWSSLSLTMFAAESFPNDQFKN